MNVDSTEPEILEQALRFFYSGSWKAVEQPQEKALLFNAKLYIFGDAYMALSLKNEAHKKCRSLLVDTICLEELNDAVDLVFSNTKGTDQDLRADILEFCAKRLNVLHIRPKENHESPSNALTAKIPTNPFSPVANATSSAAIPSGTGSKSRKSSKRRKIESIKIAQHEEELSADLVARLELEEPVAWHLQRRSAVASHGQERRLLESIQERAALEQQIRRLQAEKDEAARALALLKTHTRCRNEKCRAQLTGYEFSSSGQVRVLRCARCNCKHSQTEKKGS